jgi:hypothetical protein
MSDNVKIALWILAGMALMFIILKALSGGVDKTSDTWKYSKAILMSQQFTNLSRTNEFREIVKMPEFIKMLESVASDQLVTISKSLT